MVFGWLVLLVCVCACACVCVCVCVFNGFYLSLLHYHRKRDLIISLTWFWFGFGSRILLKENFKILEGYVNVVITVLIWVVIAEKFDSSFYVGRGEREGGKRSCWVFLICIKLSGFVICMLLSCHSVNFFSLQVIHMFAFQNLFACFWI